ncbi:MAG TPA: hypothetical protein VEW93_13230 [Acidimicrobiales bacterium]|nr:hypothetical protein [Acidimicrobiales bacterium]
MGWPRHHGPDDLDRVLDTLPDGYVVRPVGDARFVLGPTGAHVLALDDGGADVPRAVGLLASVIRSSLADQVAWVPFVHALLVTDRDEPCPPATCVPPGLVPSVLLEGPALLRPEDLRRLVASVQAGALDDLGAVAPSPRSTATHP